MAINKVELCGVNTSRLPVLNAEEKETLLKKAREGDAAARERLRQGADCPECSVRGQQQ